MPNIADLASSPARTRSAGVVGTHPPTRAVVVAAPASPADPVLVVLPDVSQRTTVTCRWSSDRGGTVPQAGANALVVWDNTGGAYLAWWEGLPPDLATQAELDAVNTALDARLDKVERRWYIDNAATNIDAANALDGLYKDHGDKATGVTVVNGDLIAIRFQCIVWNDGSGLAQAGVFLDGNIVQRRVVNQVNLQPVQCQIGTNSGKANAIATTPHGIIATGGSVTSMDTGTDHPTVALGVGDSTTDSGSTGFWSTGSEFVFKAPPGTYSVGVRFRNDISPGGLYRLRKRRTWVRVIPGNA